MDKKYSEKKIVLILGAGSTKDNSDAVTDFECPPLDKHFFLTTQLFLINSNLDQRKRKKLQYNLDYVRAYFEIWHGKNILSDSDDSLEEVASYLFDDVRTGSPSERPSFSVFLAFLNLLCDILGEKTNQMGITIENKLYQIIDLYLKKGVKPENFTIISFNYDIFAEKVLATLARYSFNPDPVIFYLQNGYEMDLKISDITLPPRPRQGFFPQNPDGSKGGIKILKLHGSLNWYSFYPSKIDLAAIYNKKRMLKVSGESEINSGWLKYRTHQGQVFETLPIIVPPIKGKSQIFHSKILRLWHKARKALIYADELVIYGYSCPPSDNESKELLEISVGRNKKIKKISIIDPSPDTCDRYIQLFRPKKILWYRDSAYF